MRRTIRGYYWRTQSVALITSLIVLLFPMNSIGVAGNTDVAYTTVKAMKVGWNLGNTLDAYSPNADAYQLAQQKRDKYQIMAVYSTKTYSGWDASPTASLTSDGSEYVLKWNIKKLNSDIKQQSGSFSFQIINQDIGDTGSKTLDFTVTKAEFIKKDGSVVKLSSIVGKHSKSIKNHVTDYTIADLTRQSKIKTAADVLGGTLTIGIKINKYPMPKAPQVTKEVYYETLWGNPVTSTIMIDDIKKAGFGAVRIPVTYYNHIDSNGKIDTAWLARVKQVVQYVIDNDMYCMINLHHDTGEKGWMKADPLTLDKTATKYKAIWKQIATSMKGYNNTLVFEGYNELLNKANKWSWADENSYQAANLLNQVFVDTVRSTGGNNAQRPLVVNTYAASAEEKEISSFVLPKDSAKQRLIVQVHYYGTSQNGIAAVVERLHKSFVSKGIPVIIGEAGMDKKNSEADRIKYGKFLVSTAKKHDITVFWWDDGNYANKAGALSNYALYDRAAKRWHHPKIVQALVSASRN